MWTPCDRRKFPGRRAFAAVLLVLGIFLSLGAAHAAPQSPDRAPATAQERSDLRHTLESRYEVLPVSGGVLLKPRQPKAGVSTIEVTGDQIAVNGERVSPRTLRDWLGADADPVLRLQAVPAAGRRQIFGLDAEPAAPAPAPPAVASPEPSAAPGATTTDTDVTETTSAEEPETPEAPEKPEAPEAPEAPSTPRRHTAGSRVNVGGSVHVERDETADEVVAVGGAADVEGDVEQGVTAIGGPARIEGKVGGDVVSVGGSVYLGPHAVVEGDVNSIGGTIQREPGAVVHGATNEVGMLPFIRHRRFHYGPIWSHWGGVSDLMGSLMGLILSGLLVSLVLLVARRPLERVDRQLVAEPWQAAAVGLAGSIFFWPLLIVVTVLLVITIIGCVLLLLYPFLLLYVALLLLLGYATVCYRLGRWLEGRFNRTFGSPYVAALTGLVAIQGWHVLGNLFDLLPGPFVFFAVLCWIFGTLAGIAALVVGFGAVILSRFGLEPGYWPRRGAPRTPVMPEAPAAPVTPEPAVDRLPLTDGERWEEPGSYSGDYPEEPR